MESLEAMNQQFLIAIDQVLNTLVNSDAEGKGWADETLSARAWRLGKRYPKTWGRFETSLNLIFFWQKDTEGNRNHCYRAYLSERERHHLPKEYRSA